MAKEEKRYIIYYHIPGQQELEIYQGLNMDEQLNNNRPFIIAYGSPLYSRSLKTDDYKGRLLWLNKTYVVEVFKLEEKD